MNKNYVPDLTHNYLKGPNGSNLSEYIEFKYNVLRFGYFKDEEIQEMWEAEQLVERDL
jgi:hypothetical protein